MSLFAQILRIAIVMLAGTVPLTAQAQDPVPDPAQRLVEATRRIATLESDTSLSEEIRKPTLDAWRAAIEDWTRARDEQAGIARTRTEAAEAPKVLETLRAELGKEAPLPDRPDPATIAPSVFEEGLSAARTNTSAARRSLEALRLERTTRTSARGSLPDQVARADQELGSRSEALAAFDATRSDPVSIATREGLEAAVAAARARLLGLQTRIETYERRSDVLDARLALATQAVARQERIEAAWEADLGTAREAEAARVASEAQRAREAAARSHPVVRNLAERNAALARETEGFTRDAGRAKQLTDAARERVVAIEQRELQVQRRVQAVGLTEEIGDSLREEQGRLPVPEELTRRAREIRDTYVTVRSSGFAREDELAAMGTVEEAARLATAAAEPALARLQAIIVEVELRVLYEKRKELLENQITAIETYRDALLEQETQVLLVRARSERFAQYISERVLWISSTDPIWRVDWAPAAEAVAWTTAGSSWADVVSDTGDTLKNPWILGGALLLFAGILFAVSRLRRFVTRIARQTQKGASLAPTLELLGVSILSALPVPLLLWIGGGALASRGSRGDLTLALGDALVTTAPFLLTLLFAREVYRPRGLAEAHFSWRPEASRLMRRHLPWFTPLATLALLAVTLFEGGAQDEWNQTAGRAAALLFTTAGTIFIVCLLHPGSGLLAPGERDRERSWLARLRWIWFLLGAGVPLALLLLLLVGFQYTATELLLRLKLTLGLAFLLSLVDALARRALVIARRRLARKQREERTEPIVVSQERGITAEEELLDLGAIDSQSRQLLKTAVFVAALLGAWAIWVDVLPALGVFREVELWSVQEKVVVEVSDGAGITQPVEQTRQSPVTLEGFLSALVILAFTMLATRNLPGLMEIVILQRLPIAQPTRYATTTLARYFLAIFGATMALGRLGLNWESIQWLVAAISVGLGFGLQEIFGNFVSGLIILFERRVRVGDVVTIGDTTGTVKRVRVLATTVENFDRKELIVPNKDIVTGTLLNWTLSNAVNRIVLTVGVAYGTDAVAAMQILERAARDHPLTLDDPAPVATFESFGDSALTLMLRVFLPTMDFRLKVITELHDRIHRDLAETGISIPFPQRDLHIIDKPSEAAGEEV